MAKRISAADVFVNAALAITASVAAVLLCIYLIQGGKPADNVTSELSAPHVIGAETEPPVTETVKITETSIVTEEATVSESTEAAAPIGEYEPEFFRKTLFIGDSLSVGFINYEFLPPENVFAQAGITPSEVTKKKIDDVSVYDKVLGFAPERICVMLGTNGLAYVEAEEMAEDLGGFIDELTRICPNAEIVIVSVPPVTKKHEEEKPEKLEFAVKYNSQIKKIAEEKNVAYADSFSLLKDGTGYMSDRYAEHDGLHLKIHAYPVILGAIQNVVIDFYGDELPSETEATSVISASPQESTAAASSQTAPAAVTAVPVSSETEAVIPEEETVFETEALPEELEENIELPY